MEREKEQEEELLIVVKDVPVAESETGKFQSLDPVEECVDPAQGYRVACALGPFLGGGGGNGSKGPAQTTAATIIPLDPATAFAGLKRGDTSCSSSEGTRAQSVTQSWQGFVGRYSPTTDKYQ
jgi:hypothetical protein